MAKEPTAVEAEVKVIEKVTHKNIFEALAAFQGENPEIKRTKEFGKEGEKMHWWYAPLDEILQTVRPLTAKHGLAFTWEKGKGEGEMVCALYHETFTGEGEEHETVTERSEVPSDGQGGGDRVSTHREIRRPVAMGVLRSMPIIVSRKGDMKDVGSNSTYARRYTLAEVLGIAPDEDNDIADQAERGKAAISSMYERAKGGIERAKTMKEIDASLGVLQKGLVAIEKGETPSLGLDKAQHEELLKMAEERKMALSEGKLDKTDPAAPAVPGHNDDAGGVTPPVKQD